jgi:hypothetical protein
MGAGVRKRAARSHRLIGPAARAAAGLLSVEFRSRRCRIEHVQAGHYVVYAARGDDEQELGAFTLEPERGESCGVTWYRGQFGGEEHEAEFILELAEFALQSGIVPVRL